MAGMRSDWEEIGPLGEGGQSKVSLVRNFKRQREREKCLRDIRTALDGDKRAELASAVWSYARPDETSELGALKAFKIPSGKGGIPAPPGYEPVERLKNEIKALQQDLPGLPKLLDFNEDERWIVTEYFPERTLEDHPFRYKGKVLPALRAFRSIVQTVALLHKQGYVHRDIKRPNVFIRTDNDLVLGDFGIVYVPDAAIRVTATDERVGPRDHMAPWAHLGTRQEDVQPNSDVYMLGKLLWCMIDGRAMLPREYHERPEFDLTITFPAEHQMHLVNRILDNCIVEHSRECLSSAQDVLQMVNTALLAIERGGQLVKDGVPRPCHVCGQGMYQAENQGEVQIWRTNSQPSLLKTRLFACDNCGHVEFFKG